MPRETVTLDTVQQLLDFLNADVHETIVVTHGTTS